MKFVNESGVDRMIRVVIGIALLASALGGIVTGGLGIFLIVIGGILLLTGVVGFCPLYRLFNFRTNKA
ncbi:MAG TPA: DUF2892 domain-containing protein [Anaerolineaceae bacterium]|nr:DUF2892 domain-containing protein [Anaerolineaceae bacterium]